MAIVAVLVVDAVVVAEAVVAAVVAAGVAEVVVAAAVVYALDEASRCKSSKSSRLSSAAIRAIIQLCRVAYRKVDGCKGSR